MTPVVMAAGLGNKQEQKCPSIQFSDAAEATADKMRQLWCVMESVMVFFMF